MKGASHCQVEMRTSPALRRTAASAHPSPTSPTRVLGGETSRRPPGRPEEASKHGRAGGSEAPALTPRSGGSGTLTGADAKSGARWRGYLPQVRLEGGVGGAGVREEGDDADEHRHREAAATGLLLASCSDRSRDRLRPPAGATPSPRPCSAHVTATERPRGRGRRGPGRAGSPARGGAGARCGRGCQGRGAPPLRSPGTAAPSLGAWGGRCARRGAARGLAESLFLPLAKRPSSQSLLFAALQSESSPDWMQGLCSPATARIRSRREKVVQGRGEDPDLFKRAAGSEAVLLRRVEPRQTRLQSRSA